ncbi:restriction endonuclease [Streptomyces sp. NPDC088194]|uniref:restriction endonuclease n=1 Tax=Streptomyces sp. NPDC088194 TaxID=3154931 RepID=UPI00344B88B3
MPPQPVQISSWQQAEHNAARWMRYWGYSGAAAKPGGADGGVDIRAIGALGQVKYKAALVGRPELQRFVGARPHGSDAQLIFFTGSNYASTAVYYAQERDIALFQYRLDGAMVPVNAAARRISSRVLPAGSPPAVSGTAEQPNFWGRNWRLIIGLALLVAPIGSIGDESTYTGPLLVDVLKGLGIFAACWAAGIFLLAFHSRTPTHFKLGVLRATVSRAEVQFAFGTRSMRVLRSADSSGSSAGPARPHSPSPRGGFNGSLGSTSSSPDEDQLTEEAVRMLSSGGRPHHVDAMLREHGVRFLDRVRTINEAKKLSKRT